MKLTKVQIFDCTDMPKDVMAAFLRNSVHGNGCYVDDYINYENEETDNDDYIDDYKKVREWLYENGAKKNKYKILIKHWW